MNFRNGYLGAFLVVIAVVLTILGSYVLSLDVENREVTRYSQVAELTGLFDSESAPTYIDYNPSTNYTGYYTDPDTKYFDGVHATTTTQPNQYRLNMEPENYSTGTTPTLTGTNWDDDRTLVNIAYYPDSLQTGYNYAGVTGRTTNAYLSEVLTNLSLDPDINLITLKSVGGKNEVDGNPPSLDPSVTEIDVDWVLFSLKDLWVESSGMGATNYYVITDQAREYLISIGQPIPKSLDGREYNKPYLSCKIDLTNSTVDLYYDNDCQEYANTYSLPDVIISFGGEVQSNQKLILSSTATYEYSTMPANTYMDIRDGVYLEESP